MEIIQDSKFKRLSRRSILAFQHVFAMFGATIVVPLLAGLSVPIGLLSAGIGTIIFYFLTKKKVPVFLGSSFSYLPGIIAYMVSQNAGTVGTESWQRAVGGLAPAIAITGLVYVILSIIVKFVGMQRIKKLFPPVVVGPIIIVIGMVLAPKILYNNVIGQYTNGAMDAWKAWTIAIVTLLSIVAVSTASKEKSFFRVTPILIGFAIGIITTITIDMIELYALSGDIAKTIIFYKFSSAGALANGIDWSQIVIFQNIGQTFGFYKYLRLDLNAVLLISPIAFVAFMEHIGDINASSAVCGKDFTVDPGINRTVLGDGLATVSAAFLGAPPKTTYGENTAVLAITQNYDPFNLFLAAIFATVLGFFTIFGNLTLTIPAPVIGGASIVLFGMISASGLKTLISSRINMNNTKNMIIVSVIMSLGLGLAALSLVGDITGDNIYKIVIGSVEISPLAISALVGVILNLVLPDRQKEIATIE
ncbi:MAG: solute carrier family 23 protein [Bacilli bacterium]|nr:solute carrier family 23 protein [Bacilli bacterium]